MLYALFRKPIVSSLISPGRMNPDALNSEHFWAQSCQSLAPRAREEVKSEQTVVI